MIYEYLSAGSIPGYSAVRVNSPSVFESVRIAWMLWKYPNKIGCLLYTDTEWLHAHLKPIRTNGDEPCP